MTESKAKKIDIISDDFDDNEYDRFCNEVPRIVREQHDLECGYNWWFDNSPRMITL